MASAPPSTACALPRFPFATVSSLLWVEEGEFAASSGIPSRAWPCKVAQIQPCYNRLGPNGFHVSSWLERGGRLTNPIWVFQEAPLFRRSLLARLLSHTRKFLALLHPIVCTFCSFTSIAWTQARPFSVILVVKSAMCNTNSKQEVVDVCQSVFPEISSQENLCRGDELVRHDRPAHTSFRLVLLHSRITSVHGDGFWESILDFAPNTIKSKM